MEKPVKTLLLVAGSGLAIWGGSALFKLYKSGVHLSIRMSGTKKLALKVNGPLNVFLQFYQDIEFANPDEKELRVKFYDAKIMLDDEVVGYTEPVGADKDFVIPPRKLHEVTNFKVIIPGSKLFSSVSEATKIITAGGGTLQEKLYDFAGRLSIVINARVNGMKLPETPIPITDQEEKVIDTKKDKKK